jgi:quinol monooxygenase YgiN
MYGTIARIKTRPGALDFLRQLAQQSKSDPPPGAVAEYIYQMDSDPNELWVVVMFESKEAYHANAQNPETHAKYEQIVPWFTEEPEWRDGEVVMKTKFKEAT